jgi:hypothetical protein
MTTPVEPAPAAPVARRRTKARRPRSGLLPYVPLLRRDLELRVVTPALLRLGVADAVLSESALP